MSRGLAHALESEQRVTADLRLTPRAGLSTAQLPVLDQNPEQNQDQNQDHFIFPGYLLFKKKKKRRL